MIRLVLLVTLSLTFHSSLLFASQVRATDDLIQMALNMLEGKLTQPSTQCRNCLNAMRNFHDLPPNKRSSLVDNGFTVTKTNAGVSATSDAAGTGLLISNDSEVAFSWVPKAGKGERVTVDVSRVEQNLIQGLSRAYEAEVAAVRGPKLLGSESAAKGKTEYARNIIKLFGEIERAEVGVNVRRACLDCLGALTSSFKNIPNPGQYRTQVRKSGKLFDGVIDISEQGSIRSMKVSSDGKAVFSYPKLP